MENVIIHMYVGMFCMVIWNIVHPSIWYILWPFCKFCGNLVHFQTYWYFLPRKIWQP
jgi:hypothetical protein